MIALGANRRQNRTQVNLRLGEFAAQRVDDFLRAADDALGSAVDAAGDFDLFRLLVGFVQRLAVCRGNDFMEDHLTSLLPRFVTASAMRTA